MATKQSLIIGIRAFALLLIIHVFLWTLANSTRVQRVVNQESPTPRYVPGYAPALSSCNFLANLTIDSDIPAITSPNYPYLYPANINCRWVLTTEFGYRVSLQFDAFVLQPPGYASGCSTDYLEITDIVSTRRFCGAQLPAGRIFMSEGPQLQLKFVSDSRWQYKGFSVKATVKNIKCGGIAETRSGRIATPAYPAAYPRNALCAWKIEGPKNSQIKLNCSEKFELEKSRRCESDFLMISLSGDDLMKNSLRFCGTYNPGVLHSVGNKINLMFRSNAYYNFAGFSCTFEILNSTSANTQLPVQSTDKCDCGNLARRRKRVIGGESVPWTLPWMVALTADGGRRLLCGGVLVAPNYVLSAAHCLRNCTPSMVHVVVENFDPKVGAANQLIPVEKFVFNKNMKNRFDYDIVLLKMKANKLDLDTSSCICLPPSNYSITGKRAQVYGWGKKTNMVEDGLHYVSLPILTDEECKKAFAKHIEITPRMFCAGEAGKDACEGDSGGPLVVDIGGKQSVIGIVSFGYGCGIEGYPGVYVKVTEIIDWIQENTGLKCA